MQGFNMGRFVPPDLEGTASGNRLHGKRPAGSRRPAQTVRFEMPYPVWCLSCPKPTVIGQGVRFNAEKRRTGNYHTTPIWSFRMRHADCGGAIEIRTDPQNTAYVVVSGARKRTTTNEEEDEEEEERRRINKDAGHEGDHHNHHHHERRRRDAFANLEKTIEDRERLQLSRDRVQELADWSDRRWADPFAVNGRLRRDFRVIREKLERDTGAARALGDSMSLGIELVAENAEDGARAAQVRFMTPPPPPATTPLLAFQRTDPVAVAQTRDTLVSKVVANTRAAKDPFLIPKKSTTTAAATTTTTTTTIGHQPPNHTTTTTPAQRLGIRRKRENKDVVDYDVDDRVETATDVVIHVDAGRPNLNTAAAAAPVTGLVLVDYDSD